jgi:DNA mismatch repair protein MutL
MSKVKVLSEQITNLIAAGEVVERPASIVKELIENSLDAGATRIRVNIQGGGRKLVQVTDNGCGMDCEDAELCLKPHATSKIRTEEDVERIKTMGFRGEAIPSIAAVTHFSILTRLHRSKIGTEVLVKGGKVERVGEAGAAPGTTVTAKNLFFNMPVRKKFLRSQQTESIHIQNVVQQQALANPNVAFELIMDGKQIFKVAISNITTRIAMLLGKSFIHEMSYIDYEESEIRVQGFIAKPGISRSTRKEQQFFINGRPVVADTLYFAVRDGYYTLVQKGRYSPVVLFLEMHSGLVDVNVHPQKREVRFRNNSLVSAVVTNAIKDGIQKFQLAQYEQRSENVSVSPQGETAIIRPGFSKLTSDDIGLPPTHAPIIDAKEEELSTSVESSQKVHSEESENSVDLDQVIQAAESILSPPTLPSVSPSSSDGEFVNKFDSEEIEAVAPSFGNGAESTLPAEDSIEAVAPKFTAQEELFEKQSHTKLFSDLKVIGSLGKRYILAEGADGLVMIDQIAAHRRIVYEQILAHSKDEINYSQPLLLPITLELTSHDRLVMAKHEKYFNQIGFVVEEFGGNTYMVSAIPAHFPQENIVGLLQQILDDLSQSCSGKIPRSSAVILAKITSKYAISLGYELKDAEVRRLLDDLAKTEMPYTCPDGQPTMINYSFSDIRRRFGIRK